jgi:SOS-response transcriptional repressor LexA
MPEVREKLRNARKAAGFRSASAAARHLGIKVSTYGSHENGTKNITPDAALLYSQAFGISLDDIYGRPAHAHFDIWPKLRLTGPLKTKLISVVGRVAAGIWAETPIDTEAAAVLGTIPFIEELEGVDRHFGLLVEGDSMNKVVQHGDQIVATPWDQVRRDVQPGDLVVVQRERNGLYEYSLKRARAGKNGIEFWPESTDPRYQTPLDTTIEDGTISVIGLAVRRISKL